MTPRTGTFLSHRLRKLLFRLLLIAIVAMLLAWSKPMGGTPLPHLADAAAQSGPAQTGQWSAPFDIGVVGIHAALVHTGKILYWQYPNGGPESPAVLYDPNTGIVKDVTVPFKRDVFCSGNSALPDGRVLVAGGSRDTGCKSGSCGIGFSELFDPVSETWADNAKMNLARYYPSNLILPDGTSLTLSGFNAAGTHLVRPMEVWDPSSGVWTRLPSSANVPATFDLFPRNFVLPNGKVFNAGGQPDTWMFDPSTNTWSFVANMNAPFRSGEGAILLPGLQKVLVAGGQASGGGLRSAEIIDLSSPTPTWVYTGSMTYGRHDLNVVLLPDGTALAVGGAQGAGSYAKPAKHAELYDPVTGKWRVLAAQKAQRGYHSTALLLPDARVISAGSDSGPLATLIEVFSPPYLFHGARASISSAPESLSYGQTFTIETPDAETIAQVTLIRADVTSHADHFEQRYVGLPFTAGSGRLTATAPSSSQEAPAGYYMLFIVNSTGVPSVAKFVQLLQ